MTKEEYLEWRNHIVTQKFVSDVIDLIDGDMAGLVVHAGLDSLDDRRRVGRIEGLKLLTEWQPQIDEDDEDDDN
jgi:hypothetical protein